MKVIEHIKKAKKPLISFEILPPLKGKGIQSIYDSIDPLMEFKPSFINVTYHREEFVYKKREKGYLEKISIKKRPGTVGICAAIMNKYQVDAIPHMICGGFTKEETENALIDLNFLGIDNVLALRGDPIKTETNFIPEEGGHA
ncbi:MAG: methylenetetrahydrofolate reductase, partial [Flavobacteriales bacterium]|nr:methylenetetrahydrofolate reductase [Flavobacteriales bacterium]